MFLKVVDHKYKHKSETPGCDKQFTAILYMPVHAYTLTYYRHVHCTNICTKMVRNIVYTAIDCIVHNAWWTRQHAFTSVCVGSLSLGDLIFFVAQYGPAPSRQNP